jgi:hypothetical protein
MLRLLDSPAASYSPVRRPHSTIGAGGLNCRVRDGNGCFTSAMATGNFAHRQGRPSWPAIIDEALK